MFDTLSDRLGRVFDRLRGRGALNEGDVREAMREVRVALARSRRGAAGGARLRRPGDREGRRPEVLRSVTPGQMVVKIVHDALVEMLGAETRRAQPRRQPAGR